MACSQSPFYQKLFEEWTEGKSNVNGEFGATKCIQKSSPKPNAEVIMFTGSIKLPARSHFCRLLRPTAKNTCPGLLFVCLLVRFYYEVFSTLQGNWKDHLPWWRASRIHRFELRLPLPPPLACR
ncbi:hypothetical protein SLE2022_345110 [Rubroshorea leprosula]